MKYFFLSYIFAGIIIVSFAGFRGHKFEESPYQIFNDMKDQAKLKYQQPSNFFDDGDGMRKPVAGTVPLGFQMPHQPASSGFEAQDYEFTHGTGYYYTGKVGDFYGDGFPPEIKVDTALIKRGQERYNIQCAVCHGQAGNGKGIFTKYSNVLPADLTGPGFDAPGNPAYRPDGKIYDVINNGWNQMGAYGANIAVSDRWAIIAYIRTLQMASKTPAK